MAPDSSVVRTEELELARLIVATLNLEVPAADINSTAPLFREGLGLDSIDVLELALAISKTYGLQLRSDQENNQIIFRSLRSLSRHIEQHRTK
jgi:acyl carrier protein